MVDSNILDDSNCRRGSGLDNLFALAHLAVMTNEERDVLSPTPTSTSTSRTSSPHTHTPTMSAMLELGEMSPSSSSNRTSHSPPRPAKKRAMPAEFDVTSVIQRYGVSATANVATPESPCSDHSMPKATSKIKPATKQKQTKSNKRRRGANTFKVKDNGPSFPVILMGIMSAPQNKEFITFLSDKNRFIVIHPGVLAKNVLPIHFDDDVPTFDQFLDLMAKWGFEIVKDPQFPQVNVFKHPMFREGDWEACLKMKLADEIDHKVIEAGEIAATSQGGNNNSQRLLDTSTSHTRDVPSVTKKNSIPDTPTHTSQTRDATTVANKHSLPLPPAPTAARSVTPPNAFLSATLFERMAVQAQRRLLLESMHSGLQQDIPQGKNMGVGYVDPFIMNNALPPDHRRVSLGDMSNTAPPSCSRGNYATTQGTMEKIRLPFDRGVYHNGQLLQHQHQMMKSNPTPCADAEAQSATQDIISAAINVLRRTDNMVHQHQARIPNSPPSICRRPTIEDVPSTTLRLDAMTEVFLERSKARLASGFMEIFHPKTGTLPPSRQQAFSGDDNARGRGFISRQSLFDSVRAEVEGHLASQNQQ